MNKWGIDIFVVGGENASIPYIHPSKPSDMSMVLLNFIFSPMPKIHINGRSSGHNSSQELDELRTSYDTSSSLMGIGRSTIAIITPTNTMYSEYSFCGIVLLIICDWFALVIMIAIRDDRSWKLKKVIFFTIVDLNVHRCTYILKSNFRVTFTNAKLSNWCNVQQVNLYLILFIIKNHISTKSCMYKLKLSTRCFELVRLSENKNCILD